MNEGSPKQQIVEGIKTNTNILVTVSDSPSVDELSAALGFTMLLNKMDKRATSIFSGEIPPAITFLDPEKTFEDAVDSLRDFIIALDKEKADHLRYKVDGDVVKIFITPYRTTLTDKDLEFSQGDYNVEMVIALGVKEQDHLDKALAAHGRILHDATVATVSLGTTPSQLGTIDWRDAAASSLCEMLVSLSEALKEDEPLLDEQVASAFLTGIVSATDRFSNDRTSSRVMTMAAQLMAAGANQQLIAAKLQEAHDIGPTAKNKTSSETDEAAPKEDKPKKEKKKKDTNSLKIERDAKTEEKKEAPAPTEEKPDVVAVAAAEAAATEAALEQAEPALDLEKQLAEQLAEVAPAVPAPAPTLEDLDKQLNETLAAEQSPQEPAPEIAAVPALPPEPTPSLSPAMPSIDNGMPGFEALDVPPAPPVAPQFSVSESIDANPGNSYVEPQAPASFDAPVENLISGANGNPDQYVDPFSVPLEPLSDVHESKDIAPISQPETFMPPQPADNPQSSLTLEEIERTAMPPLPPTDLPPLPPLPDFSDGNLPPLPPPPPPPVFDQGAAPQPGGVPQDNLGDIFGSTPPLPDTPPAPQDPPKPGQFRIPGQ